MPVCVDFIVIDILPVRQMFLNSMRQRGGRRKEGISSTCVVPCMETDVQAFWILSTSSCSFHDIVPCALELSLVICSSCAIPFNQFCKHLPFLAFPFPAACLLLYGV